MIKNEKHTLKAKINKKIKEINTSNLYQRQNLHKELLKLEEIKD